MRLLPLVGLGVVLVVHSLQFDFTSDDAYISFVYARNLAEHGALVFNLGEQVDGYSNFLWTVLLGGFAWLGVAPHKMAPLLSAGFALATLVVAFLTVEKILDRRTWLAYVAPALLSVSSGVACWTSGGLETQMFVFFVALSLYWYAFGARHRFWLLGLVLAMAAMTRPEGLLLVAVIGAHRLIDRVFGERKFACQEFSARGEWLGLAIFIVLWGGYFVWRWWYYGYPFPNTYYVKAAGPTVGEGYQTKVIAQGGYYLWIWLKQSPVVWLGPLVFVGLLRTGRGSGANRFGAVATPFGLGYLLYAIWVGGDFMGLSRFVMPAYYVAVIGASLGLYWLATRLVVRWPALRIAMVAFVLALFIASQTRLTAQATKWGNWASDRGIDTPAYLAVYAQDRAAIGKHMRQCFDADDFSIVGGAGAQVYYGRMQAIDVFGLVSREIAHTVPRSRVRPGHNKWAPDALLLKRDPEFVFSCYAIHEDPHRPRWNCDPDFWQRNGYEPVTLHIGCTEASHKVHSQRWQPRSPEMRQMGRYYSFWKRRGRTEFFCPGIVASKPDAHH